MKKRISYVIFLVSLLTLTVLCGCDKSTKSAQEKQEKRPGCWQAMSAVNWRSPALPRA